MDNRPLILTLLLDEPARSRFERERQAFFPAERNMIPAHVSMFHALPGEALPDIREALARLAARPPAAVGVRGLRSLGRGVAYTLESPAAAALRAELASQWSAWLGAQDRQPWRPHVTIQNKVEPEAARGLLARLQAGFLPFDTRAVGVSLWRYLGGPWDALDEVLFRG